MEVKAVQPLVVVKQEVEWVLLTGKMANTDFQFSSELEVVLRSFCKE